MKEPTLRNVATPQYGAIMPNAPGTTPRQIRIPADEWQEFDAAAKGQDPPTERATLVREFIRWYLRKPGAKMPKRPLVDVADGE